MKYCPYCGAEIQSGAFSFCPECGKPLSGSEEIQTPVETKQEKSRGNIPTRASRSVKKAQTETCRRNVSSLQRKSVTMMGITTMLSP